MCDALTGEMNKDMGWRVTVSGETCGLGVAGKGGGRNGVEDIRGRGRR